MDVDPPEEGHVGLWEAERRRQAANAPRFIDAWDASDDDERGVAPQQLIQSDAMDVFTVALKAKAKADSTMEEKLRASDAKFILLADTTASIHGAINPLINRAFVGTSLLKKAYTSMTDDKLKEEVREFYKGHSSAINSIVNESQSKVVEIRISTRPRVV